MEKVELVLVPHTAVGHLISMVEMAKRLLRLPGNNAFAVTVLIIKPTPERVNPAVQSYIQLTASSGLGIRFHELPSVDPPTDVHGTEDFVSQFIERHKPHVKAAVARLLSSGPVAGLVLDLFATTLTDVAHELRIPAYIYFASSGAMLALMLALPMLEEKITVEFEDMEGEVHVPGLPPIPPLSMPSFLVNKKSRRYTWFVYHGRRFLEAKGIITNTFTELERATLAAIADGLCAPNHPTPAIYPVGPVLDFGETRCKAESGSHECVRWLNGQPEKSVVFLCFGSKGCFDAPQLIEMASVLERSGHRFLWVLRSVPGEGMHLPTDADLDELLPERFLERTRGRGMVWPSWAQQKAILAHEAVGAFVTHCGWNSSLESLWFGVPMILWPLYAEQHLNAFVMAREMGVAVELKRDRKAGNFVSAAELERGVRCLMEDCEEGRRVRTKVEEMRLACRKALGEGGSSSIHLGKLAKELTQGERPS